MLAIFPCVECGKPKKTRKGHLCQSCNGRFNGKYGNHQQTVWSSEEVNLLKMVYSVMPTEEVLKQFPNRSRKSVIRKVRRLGLEKDVVRVNHYVLRKICGCTL